MSAVAYFFADIYGVSFIYPQLFIQMFSIVVYLKTVPQFFQTIYTSEIIATYTALKFCIKDVTKTAVSCRFGHIYWRNSWCKISFFVQC